jgi:phenylalanine-4-hydroxylase
MLARHGLTGLSRKFAGSAVINKNLMVAPDRMVMKIKSERNRVGLMEDILRIFAEKQVNLMSADGNVVQRDMKGEEKCLFQICFDKPKGNGTLQAIEQDLKANRLSCELLKPARVAWFPAKESDLDMIGTTLQKPGDGLNQDHPGFKDADYKRRRNVIGDQTLGYKMGNPIPKVDYNGEEQKLWKYIYDQVRPLHKKYGCKEYLEAMEKLESDGIFTPNRIPQLEDLNSWLKAETNFRVKPVNGILSQREFLNCLALRTFCSTQYIRHPTKPDYTPEPDIMHEFLGHIPNFANKKICDISQAMGILSLGATDAQVAMIGAIYWFTIEFGLCMENGITKFYGAGPGGSFGEILHVEKMIKESPQNIYKLDIINNPPPVNFVVQDVQPFYYAAESFDNFLQQLEDYSKTFYKPFYMTYDERNNSFEVDRALQLIAPLEDN